MIYFDVPKAASSTIRSHFFDNDLTLSLREPVRPIKNYTTFTFVRNPWDRFVSNWKMFTQKPYRKSQLESMVGSSEQSIGEFFDVIQNNRNHHWMPQSLYVPEEVGFVGRLESFTEDMERLHEMTGTRFVRSAFSEKLNPTHRLASYRDYFLGRDDLVDGLAEIYKVDIDRFKYSF